MSRTAVAMITAPAVAPVLMLTELSAYATSERWFAAYIAVAKVFSYVGALGLGAPALMFAWSRKYTSLWVTVLVGLAVSALTWLVFGLLFGLSLDYSFSAAVSQTIKPTFLSGLFWPAGVCGAAVAVAIWVIARPDRLGAQQVAA